MPTTCAFNSDPIATPAANKVTLAGEEGLTDSRADRKELRAACAPSSSARRRRYLPSNPRGVLSSPSPRGDAFAAPAACSRPGCPRLPPRKGGGSSAVTGDAALRRWPRAGAPDPQRRCRGGTAVRLRQQDPQLRVVPGLLLVMPRVGG